MFSNKPLYLDHPLYRYLLPFATTRTQVASSLITQKYPHVLDLGCSNGHFLIKNRQYFSQAIGLDLSRKKINIASKTAINQKVSNQIKFKTKNLNHLLFFPKGEFDLVISLSTIEYLLDPHHFLKQIHKVLKPNGHLIIHTFNVAFVLRRLQLLAGNLPTFNSVPGWQGGIVHNFTWPTFEKLLKEHGFQIIDKRCSGLFPPARLWARNLLCSDIIIKAQKI